ncbi:WASH complex subunit 2-like isoform X1 [Ammospiza caudacuta]|uniref:WASH complex subunit 2-like isoform X1 n=1 Tax=Ammospiza caudacuta TaxID=2857398 RepID=UPI00273964DD|nr:WASH complex subunit 2-like isoform X1 [Ammospiza caudacuta]XP_058666736.1 WASH complex subunit 2-like isoform X1 [Ammospiza caudacuta]XP_058666737.1 WASH complex subunit 2-like isoform X1 [Ammospiza caudacuta]
MNGDVAEPAPVWERPWSLDEIRKSSQSWSLASDAGLLHFLQEFSQQTISRTHEIKKQVDGLISETKATDCRLHNVFNDFLMLSNTQFIENRVYDEEVEEPIPKADVGDKTEQEKTREQKEADLIPKIQEAVNYGLQVLDSAFEQLDIKAGNSDSEEEESNERMELILEPKDLYVDRPLPYLIGSQQFMEQDDVGLGDLSSEEGSVDSDRGSVIDSEEKDEEESDDEFGNPSEDDQKTRIAQMSDEDDDDGCDLFDSEKEEDEEGDLDESTKPKKKRPTSFADELAARIKGEVPVRQDEECSSLSSETKTRKTPKEKKEVRVPSDDEDDDIFKPPKLTDDDFTPFGSRGGLFSGGTGLFDDEESDLFAEAPKGEEPKEREEQAPVSEASSTKSLKKVPAGAVFLFPGGSDVFSSTVIGEKDKKSAARSTEKTPKQPGKVVLFDNDDDDDFFVEATKKPPDPVKSTADLFDDDEGDLFKEKPAIPSVVSGTAKETESHREAIVEKKSQQSSGEDFKPLSETPPRKQRGLFSDEEDAEDLFSSSKAVKSKALPTSKSMTKAPLSLFDDDEEDLFGVGPAKKDQEKNPEARAKQSGSLKKASSLLFSSDEEEHWNVSKPAKPPSEDGRKEDPAKPASTVSQAKDVKTTSLFEEEDEEDLFAITKESQRKPQKPSLLFEDDDINGESLFSSQSVLLPSAAKVAVEKIKPAHTPPTFNEEEKEEKEDLPDETVTSNQVEDTLWYSKKPGPAPVPQGTDVAGQQIKEKPFTVISSEPADNSDLFATSPPALEKDVKSQAKKVLSLFEEEEEEKLEDDDGIKNAQKGVDVASEKSTGPKSTGVFQDEELLFSHKLQKDNDPDVDLFASPKKSMSANRILKPSPGGGLFGDDDEDDLFSTAKTNIPKMAEKKTLQTSVGPSSVSSNLENALSAKQDETLKAATTEKSTGPVPIKTKEPSSRIGKLQANLAINPSALLPGAMPKVSNLKSPLPVLDTPLHEPKEVQNSETFSATGSNEEMGVSFDQPMQADTLHNANKTRIRVPGKRRPPSRMARRLAAREAEVSEDMDSNKEPQFSLPKQMSAVESIKEPLAAEAESKENGFLSSLSLPAHSSVLSAGTNKLLPPESTENGDDLFESEDLFASSSTSRPVTQPKLKEGMPDSMANKPIKGREKKPGLGDQDSNDLFQPVQQKSSTKSSPIPFLEEEEDSLFTSQKTGKKELKSAVHQAVDPTAQDIFEDDIFATEAIKPVTKIKEMPETNLFDDNIDIFADLTAKPKEKKTKKKVEQKSIFDDDMDDIFSSSQVKIPTPKPRSSQAASEPKSESKILSTFDDPLNAFGGQ